MKKKNIVISLSMVAAVFATAALANTAVHQSFGAGSHLSSHHVVEKCFFAPGYYQPSTDSTVTSLCSNQPESYSYGEKAHWYCIECKKHFSNQACSNELSASDFQINPFTSATIDDIEEEEDLIKLNRTDKQKNVDQGTTATYVTDDEYVASFISRSNVSAATEDTTGSEIRYVFDSTNGTEVRSVMFNYRYYDVGTETTDTRTGKAHAFVQLNNQKDIYVGYAANLINDDQWHYLEIDTSTTDVGAVTFKIIGLRGYLLLSRVSIYY